jgi:hypothetical protein
MFPSADEGAIIGANENASAGCLFSPVSHPKKIIYLS